MQWTKIQTYWRNKSWLVTPTQHKSSFNIWSECVLMNVWVEKSKENKTTLQPKIQKGLNQLTESLMIFEQQI